MKRNNYFDENLLKYNCVIWTSPKFIPSNGLETSACYVKDFKLGSKINQGAVILTETIKDPMKITMDFKGRPWIINTYGEIYNFTGAEWIRQAGEATDITV